MNTEYSGIADHYRKLWFLLFNRNQGNNLQLMRAYFANILIGEIETFMPLQGRRVLDVGGARGEFCRVLHEKRKCAAVNLDPTHADRQCWPDAVAGFADCLPLESNAFDLIISRGVFEHIPPEKRLPSLREIFRVTRPGGLCYILIPPWFNPHAGHNLKPFHYLPFPAARFLRRIIFGNQVWGKSYAENGLYPLTFRGTVRLIRQSGFQLIATRDTHLRLHFMTRIWPLNELLVPAVAFIMKKDETR